MAGYFHYSNSPLFRIVQGTIRRIMSVVFARNVLATFSTALELKCLSVHKSPHLICECFLYSSLMGEVQRSYKKIVAATANCTGVPVVSTGIPSKNVPVRLRPLLAIRSESAVPSWIVLISISKCRASITRSWLINVKSRTRRPFVNVCRRPVSDNYSALARSR